MRLWRYSRWDGTQEETRFDEASALDALSDLLIEGLDLEQALEWMRQGGVDLAGLDFRVMGAEELIDALREEARSLQQRYRLDEATRELAERFARALDREEAALRREHGDESARLNDFLSRRHGPPAALSERIERMRDHLFADAEAAAEIAEMLDELERLRALEGFQRERGARFRGNEPADYETAQQLRERLEALEQMMRALAEGRFEAISPEALAELLDDPDASRSLVFLRDLEPRLRDGGWLRTREGRVELTPKAIRRLGASALANVYAELQRGRPGAHETASRGVALLRPDETRAFEFGDPLELDVGRSLLAALRRRAAAGEPASVPIELVPDDLAVREHDFSTTTTTVLLLDLSWSMSFGGRFPAAKRVALALDHLIRTRFPRDRFFVVGFSTRARLLRPGELPEATWDMGEPFTNLQEGLEIAERLIARHPSPSPQLLVITDGQPTAYFSGRELHVEWPNGLGGTSPRAVAATLGQARRLTRRGVTINTFMLDHSPELISFVERMTRENRGRAFFTGPEELGSFLILDHLARRRRVRRT